VDANPLRRWVLFAVCASVLAAAVIYTVKIAGAGAQATRSEPLPSPVLFPAISPDGRQLAFSDRNQWRVRVMDTASGAVKEVGAGDISGAAWSSDSRYLYVPGFEGSDSIYDLQSGSSRQIPHTPFRWWASDGPWLAAMEPDRSIRLWQAEGSDVSAALFPAGVEPLVVNGQGPSLGIRRVDGARDLVQVDRPGEAARVVDTNVIRTFAAYSGRQWVVSRKDGALDLHKEDGTSVQLIAAGLYDDYIGGAWSPENQWVVLIGQNMQREEFMLFTADGTKRIGGAVDRSQRLDSDRDIWWSPDSRYFAFVTYSLPREAKKANWVHRFDVQTEQRQTWRLPYSDINALREFQFVNDHTVLATLRETLYRFDLQ
jgi:WD40 repeat protein